MVDEIKAKVAARIGIIGPASDLDQPAPAVEEAVARLAVTEIGTPLIAALRGGRPPYLARNGKGERFVRAFAQKARHPLRRRVNRVIAGMECQRRAEIGNRDRKSTRLNSSHSC